MDRTIRYSFFSPLRTHVSYIPFALSSRDQLIDACRDCRAEEVAAGGVPSLGVVHDAFGECQLYVDAKDWPARRACPRSSGADRTGGCRATVELPPFGIASHGRHPSDVASLPPGSLVRDASTTSVFHVFHARSPVNLTAPAHQARTFPFLRAVSGEIMSYSINRRPLLGGASDSEFEDDLETEVDDPNVTIPDEKPFLKSYEPNDKYNLAYIVFYLLGINTLIPWSFFITADDYWMYKFREIHDNSTNLTHTYAELLEQKTDLQASFTSYLSVASALPNTLLLIINAFISKRISLTVRMVGSQCTILLLFIITTVFVKMDTDKWQNTFLIITLLTVALVNAASAIFGGSLMGIVGKFSSKYITAMSGGQALGGIFTALAEICSLWIGASPILSGLVYFIIGDTMLLLSLIAYILLERAPFFKYHMIEKVPDCLESDYSINREVSFSTSPSVPYMRIIKRIWHYGVSIFLVFFISLAVYPAVTVLVESEYKGKGYAWNDIYFVPVVTYLIFSTGDYAGRVLCGILQWPKSKPWLVVFMSVARGIFIPVLMFCNAQPRHHLPVYIHSDIYYILITIMFAVTNGYLCNLTFILAPTVVDSEEKEVASAMMGAFLGIGIASGAALSLYMVKAL